MPAHYLILLLSAVGGLDGSTLAPFPDKLIHIVSAPRKYKVRKRKMKEEKPISGARGSLLRLLLPVARFRLLHFFLAVPNFLHWWSRPSDMGAPREV